MGPPLPRCKGNHEAQAAQRFFQTHDKNQDGKLSKDEFPERVRRMFPAIDADKDGFITLAEDTAFRQKRANRNQRPQGRGTPLPEGSKVHRDLVYATVGERDLLLDLYLPPSADAPDSPESLLLGGPLQDRAQRAAAKQVNPITHITKDDPPILIQHGDRDLLVSHKQSEIFHAALQKAGIDSTLQIIKDAGHGFRGGEISRDQIIQDAFKFFDKHLNEARP